MANNELLSDHERVQQQLTKDQERAEQRRKVALLREERAKKSLEQIPSEFNARNSTLVPKKIRFLPQDMVLKLPLDTPRIKVVAFDNYEHIGNATFAITSILPISSTKKEIEELQKSIDMKFKEFVADPINKIKQQINELIKQNLPTVDLNSIISRTEDPIKFTFRSRTPQSSKFLNWCYQADRLILAAGSKAYPSTGSDGSGYTLARMAGHSCLPARPALSGILAADEEKRLLKTAEGARTYGRVRLKAGAAGEVLKEDEGEIQWTAYGLSGIVIFQLSRSVPAAGEAFLEIDLVPDREEEEIRPEIQKTIDHFGGTYSPRRLLEGYVHERVAAYLAEKAGLQDRKEVCAGELARLLKNVRIGVKGVRSFEHSQVCAGGVPLREVSPETLESRISPGLYLAGELLDIDGPCGGYNLQWAWSSGYVAGTQAAAAPGGTGPDAAAGMRKKPAQR